MKSRRESAWPQDQRDIVDLRSDTVTRPTPAMFEAMANVPLGDDVLGDEPTVTRLERLAAEKTGKEAAVFTPSGTMANQIALAAHIKPGDAILVEQEAHILYYEVGAPALLAGALTVTIPSNKGSIDPDVVAARAMKRSDHTPATTLLCLENTHNRAGGTVMSLEAMAACKKVAQERGMKIHLDGARVFNASVALGVPVKEVAKHIDSLCFCLSKGLGSPVGSLLCGDAEFIAQARVWRKRLGGGMRQSGVLAACGIVSLETMVDRLALDHDRAKDLAKGIDPLPGVSIDWSTVQTNMVLVHTEAPADRWQDELAEEGIWCFSVADRRLRLVTHNDIDDDDVARTIAAFGKVAHRKFGVVV